MGEPGPHDTIERLDVDLGYHPENCVWLNKSLQNRNTRRTRRLTLNGKTQSLKAWTEELGLNYSTVRSRLRYGWSVEEALGLSACAPSA
jgi:predicted transcriptional regulator